MSGWKEDFNLAVLEWVRRRLTEERFARQGWGNPVEILDVEEELDKGFGGSDVTAGDDPKIMLTIWWRNENGDKHFLYEEMTLTQLMKELTP